MASLTGARVRDVRVGCSLCLAAGQCLCHDEDLVWIEFEGVERK